MRNTSTQITLDVGGVEMTFTKKELIDVLYEHFNKVNFEQNQEETIRRVTRPTEGVPYLVNPSEIDWTLFKTERVDERQEEARQLILEAHENVNKHPQKYGKPFYTLIPENTGEWKTVGELRKLATNFGDHMADWVEQALEWAQRITNGETWEDLYNKADTAVWYRLVDWKNGCAWFVGGSRGVAYGIPATDDFYDDCDSNDRFNCTVPLVVLCSKIESKQNQKEPIKRPIRPVEGVPYLVNPSEIDWTLFKTERVDERQEEARQLILEAHENVNKHPQKYGKPFYTLMPEKNWAWKTAGELIELANDLGDHMADVVEQALEWAQRITNGETWEEICNKADTANCYRLISCNGSYDRLVGGSRLDSNVPLTSSVSYGNFVAYYDYLYHTVPLVVLYK